uniref:Uncharacterized protein n=1 Tax=Anguilla anguilla TaxID=7936 RepID=A0A0E9PRC1_ANGAN
MAGMLSRQVTPWQVTCTIPIQHWEIGTLQGFTQK